MSKAAVMPSAVSNAPALDGSLRDYLETNADIVTHINKPVSIDDVGALSAQSDVPIVFENIIEKPGFRLCDILVKNRTTQARALGVAPADYLKTLAFRLRQPPRGFRLLRPLPSKRSSRLARRSIGRRCRYPSTKMPMLGPMSRP